MKCKRNLNTAADCKAAPVPPLNENPPVWLKLPELCVEEVARQVDPPDWRGMNNHLVLKLKGQYSGVTAEIKTPFDAGMAEEVRKLFNYDVDLYIVRAGTEVDIK